MLVVTQILKSQILGKLLPPSGAISLACGSLSKHCGMPVTCKAGDQLPVETRAPKSAFVGLRTVTGNRSQEELQPRRYLEHDLTVN